MCRIRRPIAPRRDGRIHGLQSFEDLRKPRNAHEEDEGATAFVTRERDLFTLATDAGADDKGLGGTALSYRNAGECGAGEDGTDARDDDGLETVRSEVQYFFSSTTVYRWVTLFQL